MVYDDLKKMKNYIYFNFLTQQLSFFKNQGSHGLGYTRGF